MTSNTASRDSHSMSDGDSLEEAVVDRRQQGDPKIKPVEIFSAEDIANSVSHGVGLGMSLAGLALLIVMAAVHGGALEVVSAVVYGTTLVMLFAASTIYHSMTTPTLKRIWRVVDHSAIYLLIAGTYTPFTLITLGDGWGTLIFGIVWGLAAIGVLYKIFWFGRLPGLSMALYLGMGWTIVIAIKPLLENLPTGGLILMFTGGLLYTGGVIFYAWEKLFLNHAIWHLFVLAAAVCHYLAILLFVIMV